MFFAVLDELFKINSIGSDGVPDTASVKVLLAIQSAFEDSGVEFIGAPDDRPGVRLKNR